MKIVNEREVATMIDDIRNLKNRIGEAQKRKASMDARTKSEAKSGLYAAAEQKIQKREQDKILVHEKSAAVEKAVLYLKFSGVAAIFAACIFFLNSSLKPKDMHTDAIVVNIEEEADEIEQKTAERFIRIILSEIERGGISSIEERWTPHADEEARVQAEEMLFGTNSSSVEIGAVRKLHPSQLRVLCTRNSHPLSFRLSKTNEGIRLVSVE